jgi:hypothetical protein
MVLNTPIPQQYSSGSIEGNNMTNITEASKALFVALAEDADNWGGTPLLGGNVDITKEERGNLTQLKQAGLLHTFKDEGCIWVDFTDAGKAYALELSIEI